MSPNLDETATTRDARLIEHTRRSAFLLAVHRAIEFDGLPAPMEIQFQADGVVMLRFEPNGTADLDDWAAHLGVTAADKSTVFTSGDHPWRSYDAVGRFAKQPVELWCSHDLSDAEAAAFEAAS